MIFPFFSILLLNSVSICLNNGIHSCDTEHLDESLWKKCKTTTGPCIEGLVEEKGNIKSCAVQQTPKLKCNFTSCFSVAHDCM